MRHVLKVSLTAIVSVVASGASAGPSPIGPSPVAPKPMPTATVEWKSGNLDCAAGSFGVQVEITNPLPKPIAGTIVIDGAKNGGTLEYSVPAGQHRTFSPRTGNLLYACGSALKDVTVRVTGAAFPLAKVGTFRPNAPNYLETPPSAGSAKILSVKKVYSNAACGQPVSFYVVVRNDTDDVVDDVPVKLVYDGFSETQKKKVFKNDATYVFRTDKVVDCAGKGAPNVRYELLANPGQAATFKPRYVIYSPK